MEVASRKWPGENYRKLKTSYVLFICLFDPFGFDLPVYTFQNRCDENPAKHGLLGPVSRPRELFANFGGTFHRATAVTFSNVSPYVFRAYHLQLRPH